MNTSRGTYKDILSLPLVWTVLGEKQIKKVPLKQRSLYKILRNKVLSGMI